MARRRSLCVGIGVLAVALAAGIAPGGTAAAAGAPGSLDPTFGVRGVFAEPTATTGGGGGVPVAFLLARGSGGRIWLAGEQGLGGYLDRITSAGQQDPGFRSGHAFYTGDTADGHQSHAVLATPDGGAILADAQCCPSGAFTEWSAGVSLFHANGLRAGGFGLPRPPFPPNASAGPMYVRGIAVTAGGGAREAAYYDVDPPVVGVVSLTGATAAGKPDTALGPTGTRIIPGITRAFVMLRDGSNRLYFVGTDAAGELTVVRTSLDGIADPGYGTNGVLSVPSIMPQSLDAQLTQAGTLYAAATVNRDGTPTAVVTRLTPAGAVDAGFGAGGVAAYARAGASTGVTAIGFAAGGTLVLGITVTSASDPAQVSEYLVRVAALTGTPDPAFGSAGWYRTVERNLAIMIDSTGRLIVAGKRPDTGRGIVVRRLS
jgi:hypothetical protein